MHWERQSSFTNLCFAKLDFNGGWSCRRRNYINEFPMLTETIFALALFYFLYSPKLILAECREAWVRPVATRSWGLHSHQSLTSNVDLMNMISLFIFSISEHKKLSKGCDVLVRRCRRSCIISCQRKTTKTICSLVFFLVFLALQWTPRFFYHP